MTTTKKTDDPPSPVCEAFFLRPSAFPPMGLFSTRFFRPTSAGGRAQEPSGVKLPRERGGGGGGGGRGTFWGDGEQRRRRDEARRTVWIQITEPLESQFAFYFEKNSFLSSAGERGLPGDRADRD